MQDMETQQAVTTTPALGAAAVPADHQAKYTWLSNWRALAAAVAIVVVIAVGFGGVAVAERLLPLLFVLPCALMMLMCMRHAGGNKAPGATGAETGPSADQR